MHTFLLLLAGWLTLAAGAPAAKRPPYTGYLFVYFTGNTQAEEAIRFALSPDGYHYKALNDNQPVLNSAAISATGGVRDPHILRGADGKTFYMVATDMVSARGWNSNRGIVLLKSTDLVHWQSSAIQFPRRYAGQSTLQRVWLPRPFTMPKPVNT